MQLGEHRATRKVSGSQRAFYEREGRGHYLIWIKKRRNKPWEFGAELPSHF